MYQRRAAKFGQAHGNHIWCRSAPAWQPHRLRHTLLVEKLDEILERIDNEDIGFVITENGLPDMVLIPFRWFAENFPDEVPDDLRSADYKSG